MAKDLDVAKEISDVVALGRSWGMTDAEIKSCLEAAMVKEAYIQKSFSLSSVYYAIKTTVVVTFVTVLTIAFAYTAVSSLLLLSPKLNNEVGKLANPLVFPTLRMLRIVLKPWADRYNIGAYYSKECIISNPFYMDPINDCGPCKPRTEIVPVDENNTFRQRRFVQEVVPFIIKGYMKSSIGFDQLKQMYKENENIFIITSSSQLFSSNLATLNNITDLFSSYDTQSLSRALEGAAHISWESHSVPIAQAIRKVFTRPAFVSEEAEVSLSKRIYIDGPKSKEQILPIGSFVNNWYIQANGRRRIFLVPHPYCVMDCKAMHALLEPGDVVFYQDQFWNLHTRSEHKTFPDDLSVAFTGAFTL